MSRYDRRDKMTKDEIEQHLESIKRIAPKSYKILVAKGKDLLGLNKKEIKTEA